jgi:coenzyme PQQ biosynthesis protein PqqD
MVGINDTVQRNERMPWRIIEDEAILVNIDSEMVIHLNEVAAEIWSAMDGKRTVGEIVDTVHGMFKADRPTIEKDVVKFVNELLEKEAATVL